MKVAYQSLQAYFKETLPPPEKVAELLNEHIFEVEDIEQKNDDVVFDIKVLPDRAPYCLSNQGIAHELAALIDQKKYEENWEATYTEDNIKSVEVGEIDKNFCDRFLLVRVLNLSGKATPPWLKRSLEKVGQKSINLVVDLINFVLFETGYPLHAYNADKIEGKISVRSAKKEETIEILDGKVVKLSEEDFVVSDEKGAVAIAGIKGGKRAEITSNTSHIIVEAGHFDASLVRKSGMRLNIKNESSKRFENNVSAIKTRNVLVYFLSLLAKADPEISIGSISEINHFKLRNKEIGVSFDFIREYLGANFDTENILETLRAAYIPCQRTSDGLLVNVPEERLDLNIKEDVVDEVGRLMGYKNITGVLPEKISDIRINKEISYKNKIRNFLVGRGFSEVYNYAFDEEGEVVVANPLASDKGALRVNLSKSMQEKLTLNIHNADLLGLEKIKIFEIGKVFPKTGEKTSLCIAIAHKKTDKKNRPNDEIKIIRDELFQTLGFKAETLCTVDDTGGIISANGKTIGTINKEDGIMEVDFDSMVSNLSEVLEEENLNTQNKDIKYKSVSAYPFAIRDVAVFVPKDIPEEKVQEIILRHSNELLVRHSLFDVFTKADKETGIEVTSYAYRLVFQSYSETLSETTINKMMENITDALNAEKGWKVR